MMARGKALPVYTPLFIGVVPFCHFERQRSGFSESKEQPSRMENEELVLLATVVSYRSWRLDPTPGKSAMTEILKDSSSALGPMPLNLRT